MTGRVGAAALAVFVLAAVAACAPQEPTPPAGAPPATAADSTPSQPPAPSAPAAPAGHLRIRSTQFVRPDGAIFHWRGISAFRLVEMVANGRRADAAAYLDWAAAQQLTVVRVLTMATHLFSLSPENGVRALPELLEMAAARGLHAEVVALADTADMTVDIDAHVKAVGAIAARYPNALVEIANEPIHPTQLPRIHNPAEVTRLAALVPDVVPIALGSAEENERFSAGEYATFHFPRDSGRGGWGYVAALAGGAAMLEKWQRPLVNDEPIGAGPDLVPGRRDNDPSRFRAAALITRLTGMGATFHYEAGLQAMIPAGREAECFRAWNEAWTLLPAGIEAEGIFRRAGEPGSAVRSFAAGSALAVVERQHAGQVWVLVVNPQGEPALAWEPGWTAAEPRRLDGVWIVTATRSAPSRNSP